MTLLFFIASFTFFVWVIRNIFFWTSLWQLKEYRFDRVFIHLKETSQGRNLLFSPLLLVKWIALFSYVLVVYHDSWLFPYQVMVALIFVMQGLVVGKQFVQGLVKTPEFTFTLKAIVVFSMTLAVVALLYAFPLMDYFLWLLIIEKCIPFFVGGLVLFLGIPTEFYRDLRIQKAMKIIAQKRNLLVIGVTGSYGKSSTKDYIAQILSLKFNVLKTPGTQNTPIGIANTILSKLHDDTEIFVVEMGAYATGEIAGMCQIVKPTIGVITAVNFQHISLFKDLATTMDAKYELIESLPKDGLAIFNGNNANALSFYRKTKNRSRVLCNVIPAEAGIRILGQAENDNDKIVAYDVVVKPEEVQFSVFLHDKTVHLTTPLLGSHNVENILPGVFIADYLGMSTAQIADGVANLKSIPRTMGRIKSENGLVVIDDTFNANPDAVLAACRYLRIYKKKKILVLQPMIELGKKAKEEHYRIAKTAASICDVILLTNKNFHQSITQGVKDTRGECRVKVGNAHELGAFIQANAGRGDVVLFEGKEAQFVLQKI